MSLESSRLRRCTLGSHMTECAKPRAPRLKRSSLIAVTRDKKASSIDPK